MTQQPPRVCLKGQSWPLGATPITWQGQQGVNLAVFSRHATAVYCCLFDEQRGAEVQRIALPECTDGVWHGFVPGLQAGQLYGLRAEGPWQPAAGHRFNSAKLLIDPYARELAGGVGDLANEIAWALDDAGHELPDAHAGHELPDAHDNAVRIPKARVVDLERELAAGAAITPGPRVAPEHTLLYEAHVKGLTKLHPGIAPELRGTYAALASAPMLAHYRRLGITTLCLLPVQHHIDEKHLLDLGLANYWGYNTLAFFVPEPRYAAAPQAVRDEFRAMVGQLHRHGVEVVLDVVYNHTAEGGARGPALSWRGLDNASSYLLDGAGHYLNFTGCGNTVNLGEPRMVQFVMDSLRWWVQAFGVDGFRFDLATAMGRDPTAHHRFHPGAALLTAIVQDPVLARVKRIAEPWDLGPRGYQLGAFPPGWHEWNDRYRDTVRSYWLGHECTPGLLARRMSGSSDLFHHHGRGPLASVNMLTAHDGFTLADVTAYRHRHNEANGEHNRDGHGPNYSANGGVEGPTQNPAVLHQRAAWRRALLATLFLSQGTPQLLAGDEIGNSQHGNNNAYCQDNATSWLDWAHADESLTALAASLAALRRRYPALRHPQWFRGPAVHEPGHADVPDGDIAWLRPDGLDMSQHDWDDGSQRSFCYVVEVGDDGRPATERVMVLLHPGASVLAFVLPQGGWQLALDTAAVASGQMVSGRYELAGPAVCVLVQRVDAPRRAPEPA